MHKLYPNDINISRILFLQFMYYASKAMIHKKQSSY